MGAASVDLCSVAIGRVDAYYELGLAAWDLAAGVLVATEAGARVGELGGGPPVPGGVVVAAHPALWDDLAALLVHSGL
jgi:myo-inositol-1(or 4)-monophosphatase